MTEYFCVGSRIANGPGTCKIDSFSQKRFRHRRSPASNSSSGPSSKLWGPERFPRGKPSVEKSLDAADTSVCATGLHLRDRTRTLRCMCKRYLLPIYSGARGQHAGGQPEPATTQRLQRPAAGLCDAEGLAAGATTLAGARAERASRRVLGGPRPRKRLARRQRRRVGARAVFPGWPGAAGLSHERPGAGRQGEEVDGLGARSPAARWRHRSREEPGLVAELRNAQGAHTVPGSVGRRARDSADGEVLRLPGAAPG